MKVDIPISKSHYARIAMICSIAGIDIPYSDENDDIIAIREALTTDGKNVWVRSSGTAARFAIAYYATMDCEVVIDGNEQIRERPISSITEAVRAIGAEVSGNSLPVKIKGTAKPKNFVDADASQSSQTISALMLAGMRHGITIKTTGERNSWSYVEMTAEVMRKSGVKVEIGDEKIVVEKIDSVSVENVAIEKDWSSAVFWYGWCATRRKKIKIVGLKRGTCQPDEAAIGIFGKLGVLSEETDHEMRLCMKKNFVTDESHEVDCRRTPDLAMVLVPTLCKLKKKFKVTGLDTLEKKESRRGSNLCCELRKAGYDVQWDGKSLTWEGIMTKSYGKPDGYSDHRMVMALMILGVDEIDLQPLEKSYPELIRLKIDN